MSISIDNLPTAEQTVRNSEIRAKEYAEKVRQRAERYEQQTNTFCDMYKTYMLTCIMDTIRHWNGKEWMFVRANLDQALVIENRTCKVHFVHYGNFSARVSSWQDRRPFIAGRNPFQELQAELYIKKRWILVDESDPTKSFATVIRLYTRKPAHYDTTQPLWYGLNKLPGNLMQ